MKYKARPSEIFQLAIQLEAMRTGGVPARLLFISDSKESLKKSLSETVWLTENDLKIVNQYVSNYVTTTYQPFGPHIEPKLNSAGIKFALTGNENTMVLHKDDFTLANKYSVDHISGGSSEALSLMELWSCAPLTSKSIEPLEFAMPLKEFSESVPTSKNINSTFSSSSSSSSSTSAMSSDSTSSSSQFGVT